jgi:hypothetical protein
VHSQPSAAHKEKVNKKQPNNPSLSFFGEKFCLRRKGAKRALDENDNATSMSI